MKYSNFLTGKALLALALLLFSFEGKAQVFSESSILFAQSRFGGSARYQGLSGAATALGGDISSAFANPAGLGFNRKSEFTFAPSFSFANSTGEYFGEENQGQRFAINFDHLGVSFSNENMGENKFKGGTLAITYTRENDFNGRTFYQGLNSDNTSIIDRILFDADGVVLHDDLFTESNNGQIFDLVGLAFETYLLNPVTAQDMENPDDLPIAFNDTYTSVRPEASIQSDEVTTSGGQGSWNFSYGANFSDRFYVGASVAIKSIRYNRERVYREVIENPIFELDALTYTESLRVRGTGINLTVGGIARPTDLLRVGLTLTTPTVYQITDTYQATMLTQFNQLDIFNPTYFFNGEAYPIANDLVELPSFEIESETNELVTEYTLYTPFRAQAGVSMFLGKLGFISADLEFVGYNTMRMDSEELPNLFEAENNFVKQVYNNNVNVRIGAELRFKPIYVRAGASHYGSPTSRLGEFNADMLQLSAGIGTRNSNFYFDVAAVATPPRTQTAIPYDLGPDFTPVASLNRSKVRGLVSFGFYFD